MSDAALDQIRQHAQRAAITMIGLRLSDCKKYGDGIHPFLPFILSGGVGGDGGIIGGTNILRDLVFQFKDHGLEEVHFLGILRRKK